MKKLYELKTTPDYKKLAWTDEYVDVEAGRFMGHSNFGGLVTRCYADRKTWNVVGDACEEQFEAEEHDRDLNGARGIYLKSHALGDAPSHCNAVCV